jgi:hypothetical protein
MGFIGNPLYSIPGYSAQPAREVVRQPAAAVAIRGPKVRSGSSLQPTQYLAGLLDRLSLQVRAGLGRRAPLFYIAVADGAGPCRPTNVPEQLVETVSVGVAPCLFRPSWNRPTTLNTLVVVTSDRVPTVEASASQRNRVTLALLWTTWCCCAPSLRRPEIRH